MTAIQESVYGVTPATGNFNKLRFTSESLSGTPSTVESAQIRTDRMSSGQIVTGLGVGGEMAFELAREEALDEFFASAMYNEWETFTAQTVGLTIDASDPKNKTLTRASGSWAGDGYVPGQLANLSGFADADNNAQILVTDLVSATVLRFVGDEFMVSGTGTTTTIRRADRLRIGVNKKSFSMEKKFLDLTDKGIVYRGMIVGQMSLNVAFGQLVTGSLTFSGNDSKAVDDPTEFLTSGRSLNPAAVTPTYNGSVDMPFLAQGAVGVIDSTGLDVQSVSLTLNNNLSAQNVIGDIAPRDYSAGTASIKVSLKAYLKDGAWGLLAKKLSQASFGVGFMLKNSGGWYAFYLPAVQVSFPDPSSGGQNQDISLDMEGTAKVADDGSSALVIYRSVI